MRTWQWSSWQVGFFQPIVLQVLGYVLCPVTQSCPTLYGPMDCSPPGSSVREISQARVLEWVAISFCRGSSRPRDWTHSTCVSCIGRQILYRNCHLGSPVFRIHVNTIMKFSALHLVPSQSFVKFKKTRQGLQQDFRDDSTPLLYFSVTHKRMHGKKKKNAWVMTISLESSLQFSSFPICDYW